MEKAEHEGVTLEIRNSKGETLETRELSQNEVAAMPDLLKVRELLASGSPALALNKLMEVVGKTQGNAAINAMMEKGRREYKELQEKEEMEERLRGLKELNEEVSLIFWF